MDPFKHFLSTEEWSGSESGWTTYLASTMEDGFYSYNNNHNIKDDGEGDSDDSTVSDASSAPSQHLCRHKDGQGSHGNSHPKHDKGDYYGKHSSRKEVKKEVKSSEENNGKSKRRRGSQSKYHK